MSGELKHASVGGQLTQTEYEAVGAHVLDSQAKGDIVYASTSSQLSRLAIGTTGQVLVVSAGVPTWASTVSIPGLLTVTNSTDGASEQVAVFQGDRATPADGDEAYISLKLSDGGGNQDEQARISWLATTVADGVTQDGDLTFSALHDGALSEMFRLDGSLDLMHAWKDMLFGDGVNIILGTSGDATINYDTTDLVIKPAVVGTGDVKITGGSLKLEDSEGVILGTGFDASIKYDGTNLVITPDAVGSGYISLDGDAYVANGHGMVIGHTAQVSIGSIPEFQILGTGSEDSQMLFGRFVASSGSAQLSFVKSRSGTIGSPTIVADDDAILRIFAHADDGTDYVSRVGSIEFYVDGTPGANDTPGRLVISTTPDGSNVPVTRVIVDSTGNMTMSGDIVPGADGTYDLGVQTTAQWANVWADLVNGADYGFENGWRALEADTYKGYGPGIAFDFGAHFKTGEALTVKRTKTGTEEKVTGHDTDGTPVTKTVDVFSRERAKGVDLKPHFAVTEDFIEFAGHRLTKDIVSKLIDLATPSAVKAS